LKKILLIGSTGYIGKRLIKIIKKNFQIITPQRKKSFIDISNKDSLKKFISNDLDYIINLSGQESTKKIMKKIILQGNKNIIELVSKLKKKIEVIFFSTSLVYGYSKYQIKENSKINPLSDYAKIKTQAEKLYIKSKIHFRLLRVSNVYDKIYEGRSVIRKIFNSIYSKNKINISNINCFRNYISLDDLCLSINKMLCSGLNKKNIYNLGNENLKLITIIKMFETSSRRKVNYYNNRIKLKNIPSQKINNNLFNEEFEVLYRDQLENKIKNFYTT
jgi:nucleoside-diphosphate-sugar epimerase|tara:strand:+ start:203 stop:1027 length:825 start_codon:yes stop_codon:yes gene_type:complete